MQEFPFSLAPGIAADGSPPPADFLQRLQALGFTSRAYALTIGVSVDAVRAWCGQRKPSPSPSPAPEWALRQLELFESNYSALADYRRSYPIPVKPRGKPFEKGNTIGKRF